jgi:predicted Fe-Mo cluster-binding NifX family protein
MRIALTAQGTDLQAEIDPRFGRAGQFLLVDSDTLAVEIIANTQNLELAQGAGIQAAQNIIAHKPHVLLTGNCGPKAFKVLQTAGVKVVAGVKGPVGEAIQDYLAGRYQTTTSANVEGHWV